jgi:hypothetical protein
MKKRFRAEVPPGDKAAYSVHEFCALHDISRALFYQLRRRGSGPRIMKVAGRTLISAAAAADWRSSMEAVDGATD